MRVIRIQKKRSIPKLVILCLGLTSVALLIGGLATGNVFLIGGGAAGLFLTCGGALGLRKREAPGLV